ncbi:hypothetical protein AGMMS49940_18710 [Spirochaetia bacterium]|nr:hypothetical protein AGMMS49940_18710 [Spirochaetia bacterium]
MSETELLLKEIEGLPPGYLGKILDFVDYLKHNTPRCPGPAEKKLSERFAGALRLSDGAYNAFQNSLQEGRNEWA